MRTAVQKESEHERLGMVVQMCSREVVLVLDLDQHVRAHAVQGG